MPKYHSTRGGERNKSAGHCLLQGIASDGGLFVPAELPKLPPLAELQNLRYPELAATILKLFFDEFDYAKLLSYCKSAYSTQFNEGVKNADGTDVPPLALSQVGDDFYLELYKGPTLAFKDMALQILPYLLKEAALIQQNEGQIIILTATSGDTGKAALEAFKDIEGITIIVIYPNEGVSPTQKLHMVTQEGKNTHVLALEGNFDDAQTAVKEIFNDTAFKTKAKDKGYVFSSANSINIGRLVPQIVYYIWAYLELVKTNKIARGESINVTVPTGNFGNILAAYYAKNMGLPIAKLICASNQNNVLTQFFNQGTYSLDRPFLPGISPSMDIIISSNLERLLYHAAEGNTAKVCNLMEDLKKQNQYIIDPKMQANLKDFYAGWASEEQTLKTIAKVFENYNYPLDPHTAVAAYVNNQYKEKSGDDTKSIIVSTASPFKFAQSVNKAYGLNPDLNSTAIEQLAKHINKPIPKSLLGLEQKPILHKTVVAKDKIAQQIAEILALDITAKE